MVATHHRARRGVMTRCFWRLRWGDVALTAAWQQPKHQRGVAGQLVRPSEKSKPLALILGISLPIRMTILCAVASVYTWKTKAVKRRGKRLMIKKPMFFFANNVFALANMYFSFEFSKTKTNVPFFDFKSKLGVTNNFSEENKLGKGGFGPVYMGKFPGGEEVAVKMLSSVSAQGSEEFKTEVVLIGKLQHRNLARLLGYCIRGEEKILLYEYMPNKSLDSLFFGESSSQKLDWSIRYNIILGIARGLLYLHQDSRLRIVYRDLKTSNILLDAEMNPKISDFGLARMIQGKETESNTDVVKCSGYMALEYAIEGLFSIKPDVFSFGVVMLEIISGKRNKRIYQVEDAPSLDGYGWRLWQENKALDLTDKTVRSSCNASEFIRCVHGLLCVQEDPSERPTMADVVHMLGTQNLSLPIPKQPAYLTMKPLSATA
ncbi:Cysteine-rich receptor-like protein kinase 15 [Hibiscus syriacus]|uniref:non-specific serine/threonine protein kinase n=1 Tax=Hibiscus syriacus TaxID=106335 RepID=A0A6A2YF47_HIBSY|nr:Cysteine-rich receptor-like protein kinase 15 [Hibiscus syriacus]